MKKTKNVRVDIFAVLFFILLVFFIGSPTVSARESPITFTLHNRMFESDKMPSISQNDGINIPDNFQGVKGLDKDEQGRDAVYRFTEIKTSD